MVSAEVTSGAIPSKSASPPWSPPDCLAVDIAGAGTSGLGWLILSEEGAAAMPSLGSWSLAIQGADLNSFDKRRESFSGNCGISSKMVAYTKEVVMYMYNSACHTMPWHKRTNHSKLLVNYMYI